jgi:hypothetical protein
MFSVFSNGWPAVHLPKVHRHAKKSNSPASPRFAENAKHPPVSDQKPPEPAGDSFSSLASAKPKTVHFEQSESSEQTEQSSDSLSERKRGKLPASDSSTLTSESAMSDKLASPKEKEDMPPLKKKQVVISPDRVMDRLRLWGGPPKLVEYEDLARADLLPHHAVHLPSLGDEKKAPPLLSSRLIKLDEDDRVGAILYVPGFKKGTYIPRPVYQSSSRGVWQAPNFIQRDQHVGKIQYLGKGEKARGKMQTALSPDVQVFLSRLQKEYPPDAQVSQNETKVLMGTAHSHSLDESDQRNHNRVFSLEDLYPGSHIDSIGPEVMDAKATPLSPKSFHLPEAAHPDFSKKPVYEYNVPTKLYGSVNAEVYSSKDRQLLWTYFKQPATGRVWVAAAHLDWERMAETGLPERLMNIGHTIPLAPYEHYQELDGLEGLPLQGQTPYVDIWNRYTSKGPLVKAYYKAKKITCPK